MSPELKELSKTAIGILIGYLVAGLGLIGSSIFCVALAICIMAYYPELKSMWQQIRDSYVNNRDPSGKN